MTYRIRVQKPGRLYLPAIKNLVRGIPSAQKEQSHLIEMLDDSVLPAAEPDGRRRRPPDEPSLSVSGSGFV
jgi:hypothetical protein